LEEEPSIWHREDTQGIKRWQNWQLEVEEVTYAQAENESVEDEREFGTNKREKQLHGG
jgi:hypothetical protein